jgi:threonylcarbamoyladenosine tRNA methylthiotransferase MtaB
MGRFCLVSFGCRASQADGAAVKRQLIEMGLHAADSFDGCDWVILNTCTVTQAADAEARQIIRRVRRKHPACKILVTGCYAQRAPEEIAKLPGVVWVVGNSHRHRIHEIVRRELGFPFSSAGREDVGDACREAERSEVVQIRGGSESLPDLWPGRVGGKAAILAGEIGDAFHFAPVFADDRTRPTLKIQDGCNAECSFCVIPRVRGRSRSMPVDLAVRQMAALADQGYREVVLSGINLGSYGRDLTPRANFLGLLDRILRETSIERIRMSSIEPMDVTRELIELAADESRLAEHFHVPLQSGCNRILRLMNRRYWAQHYRERVAAIRERLPNAAIGADVMAGFPTETADEHAETLRLIESLPLTYLHVFPYSARPTTRAANLPDPMDGRRIHDRCRDLQALGKTKQEAFQAAQLGRTLSVLTLHETEGDTRKALSNNYLKVNLVGDRVPPNVILEARVVRIENGLAGTRLVGEPAGLAAVSAGLSSRPAPAVTAG